MIANMIVFIVSLVIVLACGICIGSCYPVGAKK